jgi:aquaporin Z
MRNYIVELIGTFFLVLVIGLTGNPLAIGAILIAMVYMGGHISGAHYNPAVTFAIFIRKKINMNDAMMYILFQFAGALLAAFTYYLIKGTTFASAPATEASNMSSLLVEIAFTFALVSVVLNVATSKKTLGNNFYGLAIGLTVMAGAFAGGPISGGVFNPAVGLGPIVIDGLISGNSIAPLGLYIVGPFVGSILAVIAYRTINPEEMAE